MNSINHSIITISGEPRSGKSTTISNLKKYYSSLGMDVVHLSIGDLARQLAQKEGISITEFNKLLASRPEIDKKLDDLLVETGRRIQQNPRENTIYLIDSRLAWHFIPESFSIRLTVDEKEAGKRAFSDNSRKEDRYSTLEEAISSTAQRESAELARYKALYGVDLTDSENYNLVINTTGVPAQAVSDTIARCISFSEKGYTVCKHWASPGLFLPTQDIRQSENSSFNNIMDSIKTEGFAPNLPIKSVAALDNLWVVDGHNRVGASFDAGNPLIAYELLATDDEKMSSGISAKDFVLSESTNTRGQFHTLDYDGWWKFIPNIDKVYKVIKEAKASYKEER